MGKHVDSGDDGPQNPVISVVAYLSDDHEGGELNFDEQGLTIKPKAGSIVVFPSRKPYFHASLAVTEGTKYVALGFWHLPSSL
jgi:Rps23 Pro-64 3,4-dihydroxylase Tpa1-like proline 4-hydroxylase